MSDSRASQSLQFLDIEGSSYDEDSFPVSITWSLPDGQVKTVLVMPDDEWNPQDATIPAEMLQHLYDHGVSGADIIREMNSDLDGSSIYIDGLDYDDELLEKLYDACEEDPTFELAPISELYTDKRFEEIMDARNLIMQDNNLDSKQSEHNVLSLLMLAREFGLM